MKYSFQATRAGEINSSPDGQSRIAGGGEGYGGAVLELGGRLLGVELG